MALDDYSFDLDDLDSGQGEKNNKVSEVSEKLKEAIKKGSAGIKRTQKDEKKAKKYDFILANFLVKIIINKKYDSIIGNIFKTMDFGYNSNFVIGILSLINKEISDKIRETSGKEQITFDFFSQESIVFDDNNIPNEIRKRINLWIEDMIDGMTLEYSNIQNKNNLKVLEKDSRVITIFTAQIFSFFLKELNITINKEKAISISEFIISEIKKSLRKIKIEEI